MKLFFEWMVFAYSSFGIIFSIYLLYFEITKKGEKNRDRLFLLIFVILALAEVLERKINFLF